MLSVSAPRHHDHTLSWLGSIPFPPSLTLNVLWAVHLIPSSSPFCTPPFTHLMDLFVSSPESFCPSRMPATFYSFSFICLNVQLVLPGQWFQKRTACYRIHCSFDLLPVAFHLSLGLFSCVCFLFCKGPENLMWALEPHERWLTGHLPFSSWPIHGCSRGKAVQISGLTGLFLPWHT